MLRRSPAVTSPLCPRCATARPSDDARFCARCGQRFDASDAADPLLGSVLLGRYRVTLKLGEGRWARGLPARIAGLLATVRLMSGVRSVYCTHLGFGRCGLGHLPNGRLLVVRPPFCGHPRGIDGRREWR